MEIRAGKRSKSVIELQDLLSLPHAKPTLIGFKFYYTNSEQLTWLEDPHSSWYKGTTINVRGGGISLSVLSIAIYM